ncbi:MAG TPA: helix-turn-helix domain-containing protein [Nocardioides sp.]|nr:helix-turn-helix domain-containing protein [Nocardioides sp.]
MADEEIASLRAAAHPVRLRMLSLLTAEAMSAAEVARELGITHANASYHLRVLHDADLIVVDGEERIRGGVAKRYRYDHTRDARQGAKVDVEAELRVMGREMVRRFAEGHRGPMTYADAELWVTPETWEEVLDLLRRGSALLHDRALRPRTEGAVPVNLSVAAFRMDGDPS